MAGSHTMMPGILLSNNTVLNVANTVSSIGNNQTPLNHINGGLGISLNGHSNNIATTTSILRPANKIIVQGPNNVTVVGLNSIQQGNNSHSINYNNIHTSNSGIIGKNSANNMYNENIFQNSHVNESTNENLGIPDSIKNEPDIKNEIEIIEENIEEEPEIDIMINNVVCSFSVGCHLDLRHIALTAHNVEFRKENGMVTLKLRRPLTTASIWSSGKITCTGSTSEEQARTAARRVARSLQKLGYNAKFRNYRIVNVLGTCTMPFAIKICQFSEKHRKAASYEPELHPGVTYRIESPKATLKIFSTGSITVTAPSIENVKCAIETIYPLVNEFSKQRSVEEVKEIRKIKKQRVLAQAESEEEDEEDSDMDV